MRKLASALLIVVTMCGCTSKPPYEGKSVAQLEAMLRDPARQVQGAFGLSRLGEQALPALPALVEALKKGPVLVREYAALALGKIGPAGKEAVPGLTDALGDPEWTVRRQGALALGHIGPEGRSAQGRLEKLAEDENHLVREAARTALKAISP
jgi:HEAT repeat protein